MPTVTDALNELHKPRASAQPTVKEMIAEILAQPSTSVPTAGKLLADLSVNGSYLAARNGELGVPTFWVGGKIRVASIDVLRKLGLAEASDAKRESNTSKHQQENAEIA
jgi:hypothetical protein